MEEVIHSPPVSPPQVAWKCHNNLAARRYSVGSRRQSQGQGWGYSSEEEENVKRLH